MSFPALMVCWIALHGKSLRRHGVAKGSLRRHGVTKGSLLRHIAKGQHIAKGINTKWTHRVTTIGHTHWAAHVWIGYKRISTVERVAVRRVKWHVVTIVSIVWTNNLIRVCLLSLLLQLIRLSNFWF